MSQCTKHYRPTVQGEPPCPWCENERLHEALRCLLAKVHALELELQEWKEAAERLAQNSGAV